MKSLPLLAAGARLASFARAFTAAPYAAKKSAQTK
jgi:hypothetical protein